MNELKEQHALPEANEKLNLFGRWAAFFVERYRVVYLIVLILTILGTGAYFTLPREMSPEVVLPYGSVFTLYPGAAPNEVERQVTEKIENSLSDISDIKVVESSSRSGYSQVFVEFEQGVVLKDKLNEMTEKVNSILSDLPSDAETPLVEGFESNTAAIMIVNITGDYDFVALKDMSEVIGTRIETVAGVKEAIVVGGLEREITIWVDPLKLEAYGLTLETLHNALASSNVTIPGGNAVLDGTEFNIRTIGEFEQVEDIKNIILSQSGGQYLYLKDVARVVDGYEAPESYSRMADQLGTEEAAVKPNISIAVKKKNSADIIRTAEAVRTLIADEKGTLYPDDLSVVITGDTSKYVKDQLGGVAGNALSGLILVMMVLFLFIGLGESLIVSAVIPLSILSALWLFKVFDLTLNSITLFSLVLAVGMLVDNGIVIMENIDRLRFKGLSSRDAAVVGTNQIAGAVFSSMLTTVAAFFPILLTSGIMGSFIKPIPMTVIFALVSSFFIAVTVTPALCSKVLVKHRGEEQTESPKRRNLKKILSIVFVLVLTVVAFREDGQIGVLSLTFGALFTSIMIFKQMAKNKSIEESFIIQKYGQFLSGILVSKKKRWATLGTMAVAFILSMSLVFTGVLKVEMFANEDQDRLYVNIETPIGTPLQRTDTLVAEVEQRLMDIPEIITFVSNVGTYGVDSLNDFSTSSTGNGTIGQIIIDLTPVDERERTSMEIADVIRDRIADLPGGKISVQELSSGPPSGTAVMIKVMGEDLDALKQVTQDFESTLKTIPGVSNVNSSVSQGQSELQIVIDKTKAKAYGLQEAMIGLAVRNATEGYKATTFRTELDDINVVLRTESQSLTSIEQIKSIAIQNPSGQIVKLGDVADVKIAEGLNGINRENSDRRMYVGSDVLEGYNAVEVTAAFEEATKDYPLPEGITIQYSGVVQDIEETFTEMLINMLIAVILVFLILAVQFNSLSQPMIILITLPLAMIGVMPGLYFTGNTFGFVAFIGVVALVGIAVNDAIVLVDYANYLRKNGQPLMEALVETGKSRFIPVLATTITTAGGILPLSIKEKFFQPMGMALIFGLSVATILTLIIIPVLYTMQALAKEKKAQKKIQKELKRNGGTYNETMAYTTPSA